MIMQQELALDVIKGNNPANTKKFYNKDSARNTNNNSSNKIQVTRNKSRTGGE